MTARKYKDIVARLFLCCFSIGALAQETTSAVDSLPPENEKRLLLNLDLVSRYIWRGQCWGGNYVAVQPTIEYAVTPRFSLGFWATTNFQDEYFYADGVSAYKGYQETDFYLTYQINDYVQFQLWDYYWPSVSRVEGVDNSFFNYGKNSVKTVDAMLYFDFSEGYRYPFNATISTLIAGNDFRYDSQGENPKQNFTTYLELGYTFTFFETAAAKLFRGIEISPVAGLVLNNRAEYYSYADYDKPSFVNLGVAVNKEFDLGKGITMPISLSYTHNGATRNTELFGQNFFVAKMSFSY